MKDDPDVNLCIQSSCNNFVGHMRSGIPELELERPEPITIDEIGISLGNQPNAYRATFRDIKAYGISNMTVTNVRSVRT